MSGSRPLVFLFRSGDEADPYEKTLEEAGFEARCIPVLRIEYVNGEELRRRLEHPKRYGGIIVTSPRAVDALAEAMPWLPSENIAWHGKPVFCVGPRTAANLRLIGFEPAGEESGTAESLASLIAAYGGPQTLLFLSGDRRRDLLPDALKKAGVAVEELCVYATRPRLDLDFSSSERPDWGVFFSPSGIDAVEAARGFDLHAVSIAAIGPTTAEELRLRGYHVRAVAEAPSPDSLKKALVAIRF